MSFPDTNDFQDDNQQRLLEKFLFPVRTLQRKRLAAIISQKTILITGASYGIGALLTEILSDFEVHLILVARTSERLDELKQSLQNKPSSIVVYPTDIREESQVNSLLDKFTEAKTEIDLFINNAGKSSTGALRHP
jgi:short-subunit dehydrogenase